MSREILLRSRFSSAFSCDPSLPSFCLKRRFSLDLGFFTLKLCPLLRRKRAALNPFADTLLLALLTLFDLPSHGEEGLGQGEGEHGTCLTTVMNRFILSLLLLGEQARRLGLFVQLEVRPDGKFGRLAMASQSFSRGECR